VVICLLIFPRCLCFGPSLRTSPESPSPSFGLLFSLIFCGIMLRTFFWGPPISHSRLYVSYLGIPLFGISSLMLIFLTRAAPPSFSYPCDLSLRVDPSSCLGGLFDPHFRPFCSLSSGFVIYTKKKWSLNSSLLFCVIFG